MAGQAAEQTAQLNLEYTEIRSPIDGRTGNLMLHPGNLVKANDSASAIVVINQIKPIFVDFNVQEKDLEGVRRDMTGHQRAVLVRPRSRELQAVAERGTLNFIDNAVNASTGTFELKGLVANERERLWPGQFVDVTLTLSELPDTILVPSQAVQTGQDGAFVFVVERDMSAKARPVVVGDSLYGQTVIKSGIKAAGTAVPDHRRPGPDDFDQHSGADQHHARVRARPQHRRRRAGRAGGDRGRPVATAAGDAEPALLREGQPGRQAGALPRTELPDPAALAGRRVRRNLPRRAHLDDQRRRAGCGVRLAEIRVARPGRSAGAGR